MGTVPVPYSPIAGDDATQARVLTWADAAAYLLGSATSGGSKRPLSVMRQTVVQSIATSTWTSLLLDTEDVDYDNGHSTVTNTSRYTVQTAGWYLVSGMVSFATNVTGLRFAQLTKNGTPIAGTQFAMGALTANSTQPATRSSLVFCNVGDFLEVQGWQNSGGALNTLVGFPEAAATLQVEWRSN